jgi:hypothetical protein
MGLIEPFEAITVGLKKKQEVVGHVQEANMAMYKPLVVVQLNPWTWYNKCTI